MIRRKREGLPDLRDTTIGVLSIEKSSKPEVHIGLPGMLLNHLFELLDRSLNIEFHRGSHSRTKFKNQIAVGLRHLEGKPGPTESRDARRGDGLGRLTARPDRFGENRDRLLLAVCASGAGSSNFSNSTWPKLSKAAS